MRVLIVEDDPFARNWMALLLARDWRTRLVADVGSPQALRRQLEETPSRLDLVILDTEMPADRQWLERALETISAHKSPPRVLCTGTHADLQVLRRAFIPTLRGYILKNEIEFSLAWAVDLISQDKWVVTPGIEKLALEACVDLPRPYCVIDGRKSIWSLSDHQLRVARLAFLFSMERRELADEMQVTAEWSYGLVSGLYKELGIGAPPALEFDPRELFGNNRILIGHFKRISAGAGSARKGKDLETLAFHLLTIPEIREYD